MVKFNRWEPETSGRFTFLGFDFFWRKTLRNPNHRKVTRYTNGKKFRASLAALKEWLKKARSKPLRDILATLRRKLQGYWNYYCVIGNSEKTGTYAHHARGLVFKWHASSLSCAVWPRLNGPRVCGHHGKPFWKCGASLLRGFRWLASRPTNSSLMRCKACRWRPRAWPRRRLPGRFGLTVSLPCLPPSR